MQKSLGTIAAVYRGLDLLILCNMGHLFIFQVITFQLIYASSVSNKTLCECQLTIPSHQTLYMKDTSSLLFSFWFIWLSIFIVDYAVQCFGPSKMSNWSLEDQVVHHFLTWERAFQEFYMGTYKTQRFDKKNCCVFLLKLKYMADWLPERAGLAIQAIKE